jgi:hypothetical protein
VTAAALITVIERKYETKLLKYDEMSTLYNQPSTAGAETYRNYAPHSLHRNSGIFGLLLLHGLSKGCNAEKQGAERLRSLECYGGQGQQQGSESEQDPGCSEAGEAKRMTWIIQTVQTISKHSSLFISVFLIDMSCRRLRLCTAAPAG